MQTTEGMSQQGGQGWVLCSPRCWPRTGGQSCRQGSVLTLSLAVHAVGVASDVPDGLQGHGLVLTRQARLQGGKDINEQQARTQKPQMTPLPAERTANPKAQTKVE